MPSMMGGRPRMRMGRDYRMSRDYRMPYPYMDSRRMRDRGMERTRYPEYDGRYDYESYDRPNRQPMDRGYDMEHSRNINYMGRYGNVPFRVNSSEDYPLYDSRMYSDYMYDYAMGNRLDERELEDWAHELLEEVDDKDREMLKKEKILKRAEEMGIKFDKFSMEEFYTVVLMMFTDYHKTLGTTNMEVYLRLAKDWLCDEDTAVQYGEKLAVYYDAVVEGM